eukprot:8948223-Alexandrium_andersonii.AAC.1
MEIKPQKGADAKLSGAAARGGEGCYFYEGLKDSYQCWYYSVSTRMTDGVGTNVFWRARRGCGRSPTRRAAGSTRRRATNS